MKRLFLFLSSLTLLTLACGLPSSAGTAPQTQPPQSPGSVLLQDDFSNRDSGFDHFMAAEGIMDYDSGGYRILVNALQTNFWATPRVDLKDVNIAVDVGKLGGPDDNRIGLLCRFYDNNYYFFLITSDGFYGVGIYFNEQAILLGQSELQESPAIKKGLAVNHLRAVCAGSTLAFYVNDVELVNLQDGTLQAGDVGILAGTFGAPGVDIIFDNFVVIQP